MTTVADVCDFLEHFAPTHLAEDWDNVGLLVGRGERPVHAVMTCLSLTVRSVSEAVEQHADLVVAHHPLPFRPLKQITAATTPGRLLLELIEAGVAVYSPHTAFDSAMHGINQALAEMIGLAEVRPLLPLEPEVEQALGVGRWGTLAAGTTTADVVQRLKQALHQEHVQVVGGHQRPVTRVAVGCGSAGQLLEHARRNRCDLFVTGETNFHTCLEAEAIGIGLLLLGHYASERFAVERLAEALTKSFPDARVWASREERDPLQWV
jgi:dinuclear metal center YbgI/SA1388 family protein